MHYFISDKEFEQPENVRVYSRKEFENLFAFRHQTDPQQALHVRQEQLTYGVDSWEVVNPVSYTHLDVYKRQLQDSSGVPSKHLLPVDDTTCDCVTYFLVNTPFSF